ncbi:ABC1 kinase family protein [Galbitalea soli]|uniref:AarF/ABC1/UbiB kinase family protein n=1 Tax=Galbitalea soli TaxID=1268042 RepID=A0A7C9TUA4_9MICO|nr:AarF/UbiB family protein [Galbitalea soli]NEM92544.1 AarF/ABC1/UbiB kinase family protein [Galbitalea soli]NYJ29581.1 putative unusual protein kinase regulating ubiquinone biosynthesis (AarF/ABC1/UbiB family) [Galbitalea soli]
MTDAGTMRARYRRILRFAARYLLQAWWYELFLPRIGLARLAARGRSARLVTIARRFHVLAVDLGGLMIKVGQFMSSRLDVLPPEITKELEGLQDEVPAVPFAAIRALAESELGVALERAYSFIDETPLAAASLGQVHRARLSEQDAAQSGLLDVVVKVQRPGIDVIVDVDLRALRKVADWLSRVRLVSDRVDMPTLVEEFALTSLEEIDYLHEASNAERFAHNFEGDDRVAVPELVWERTTRRVLTLQDVTAIKINDVDALRAAGIDPSEVANEFAAVMFDQLFVGGYFHADPHPGNIFVTPRAPAAPGTADAGRAWAFTFVDFGMMGRVPDNLRKGLQKVLIAAASRDGKGMVEGIRGVGILLPSADTVDLERAMTKLFSRFGGMGFAELQTVDPAEFRAFAIEFGDVVRTLPFQLPENFLLVVRAMSLTSGMCSSLDPAFNIWNAVEPYSDRLLRTEGGNVVQAAAKQAMSYAGLVARLPGRLDSLVTQIEEGRLSVQSPRIERRLTGLERTGRRVISAVLFAALFIGGIILRGEDAVFGTVVMAVSALPLLHALLAGIVARRGPLG